VSQYGHSNFSTTNLFFFQPKYFFEKCPATSVCLSILSLFEFLESRVQFLTKTVYPTGLRVKPILRVPKIPPKIRKVKVVMSKIRQYMCLCDTLSDTFEGIWCLCCEIGVLTARLGKRVCVIKRKESVCHRMCISSSVCVIKCVCHERPSR